jgi:hypothetical protein
MYETKTVQKLEVPVEMQNLPIMQFIGDSLPAPMQTPEAKKTVSKAIVYGSFVAIAGLFIYNLKSITETVSGLIDFSVKLAILGLAAGGLILMAVLGPGIIDLLHKAGDIQIFKWRKKQIEDNPIESLQMLMQEQDTVLREVDKKINEVSGTREGFTRDAQDLDVSAEKQLQIALNLAKDAKKMSENVPELQAKGLTEKANQTTRDAKETTNTAYLAKTEAMGKKDTAAMFAQYSNQFGKVIEILKDNRSALRIQMSATKTSINMLERQLSATSRMKNATEGLAAAFNMKDSYVFVTAMNSAKATISNNVASIRNNIQLLNQNAALNGGSTSANKAELDLFIQQMEQGQIKKLNVSEIVDTEHELTTAEKVDAGFSIL